ncbi:hypothetical protein RhiirC2_770748 [Rhizophagus irregularis]|uniref:F-box domain-containing protein n=1 Tax=Rhizophagus irregularis TaxID=588596 RepID=A0A2N1NVK8_9GLOM|nr:hypothetical protein RhiirC2_770748 [Rhizophagus irregularis]
MESLYGELKVEIFRYVFTPMSLVLLNRNWYSMSQDPHARAEWIIYKNATNDSAHPPSEDEQFEDALASPKLLAISTVPKSKEELEDYNKLNNGFSTRINEING